MYADFLVCGAVASAVPPEEVHVREYLFELLLLCVVVVPVNHNLTRKVISSIIIKISNSNHLLPLPCGEGAGQVCGRRDQLGLVSKHEEG